MTTVQQSTTPEDGTEQLARQLASLRRRSRRVAREVRRIRAEMIDLLDRIDSHFSSQDSLP